MRRTLGGLAVAAALFGLTSRAFAIEGLKLNIQGSNAVLSWPSRTGEVYIVRYRPDLDTNTGWALLTNSLPGAPNTNWTKFTHWGVVTYPNCPTNGGGGVGGPPAPGMASQMDTGITMAPYPLDDTEVDFLSKHRVFPPYVWELEQRAPHSWEIQARPPAPWDPEMVALTQARSLSSSRSAELMDSALANNSGSNCPPATGFWEVVRAGIHLVGITNGMKLSGVRTIPIEVGYDTGLSFDSIYATASTNQDDVTGLPGFSIDEPRGGPLVATWDTARATN